MKNRKLFAVVAAVGLATVLSQNANAGFEYDPVVNPDICTEFEAEQGDKKVEMYIEEMASIYAVDVDHIAGLKKLARAEGSLKFRDAFFVSKSAGQH